MNKKLKRMVKAANFLARLKHGQSRKLSWKRVVDGGLTLTIAAMVLGLGVQSYASLDAPSAPTDASSQSYTLADVCNRLATGAEGTIATTFTEPEVAPDQDMCTLNEIYDLTPQPNEVTAAQSGDVLDTATFWALNPAGQWGIATGTLAELFKVLNATGQDTCYNTSGDVVSCDGTGQDGEYQLGDTTADPRFVNNGDGTVTDNLTGFIWLDLYAECFSTENWQSALNDVSTLASGSCSLTDGSSAGDWRLPNFRELESLIGYQQSSPALPSGHAFSNPFPGNTWTSTSGSATPGTAWFINFGTGRSGTCSKSSCGHAVLPLRQ